jgi:hypothetical protein
MPEDAVLETPIEEIAEPVEVAESVEGAESTEGAESGGEALSGAPLWKAIKDSFTGKDAKTTAQVRKALFDASEIGKRHPEGLKGIDAVLESVKKLSADSETPDAMPVEQVIEETLQERSFWRDFDTKFQAGSPELIEQMATANPESFNALIPAAINKFAEVNPEGYSSIVSKAVVQYLADQDIPLQIKLLDRIIPTESSDPAVQQLIEGYGAIKKALDGLSAMAAKPLSAPKRVEEAAKPGDTSSLEDRETRILDAEWNRDVAATSNSLMVTEAQKILGKGKLTQDEVNSIKSKVKEEINARISVNSGYQSAIKAYLKANNRNAYLQRVNSEHKKIIPGAVKRALDDVISARKTAPKVAAKPVAVAAKPGVQQAQSSLKLERIAGSPTTQGLKVDLNRTPQSMLVKRQAYIVGRANPVSWGQK